MTQLTTENSTFLVDLAVRQAAKARKAWENAQSAAFELAKQAIDNDADPRAIIESVRGICTEQQIAELAGDDSWIHDTSSSMRVVRAMTAK